MITPFGPAAERYAAGLGTLDAIITDLHHLPAAFAAGVARRERGEPFYAMVLADDRRAEFAYSISNELSAQITDRDVRRGVFRKLADGSLIVNGNAVSANWSGPPRLALAVREFFGLSNGMLVRSYTEFVELATWLGHTPPPVERVLAETQLPDVERIAPTQPSVVLWGPRRPPGHFALHLTGLSEFLGELTCIAGTGAELSAYGPALLHPDDPAVAEVLARAVAIVCIEPSDPSDAVAFARRGYGVVAPLTSGAHEFAPEVVVWDAANAERLHATVAVALGRPASVRGIFVPVPAFPAPPPQPAHIAQLPLVTIVIPSYNRPADLRRVLHAATTQTYPAVETIVVNDAGTAVDDIVAAFPGVRLITHPQNRGVIGACETGTQAARGEYICYLPDDDWMYPDHVERVMFALLRAGAKIAHGNGLLRFSDRQPDGSWKTTGFNGHLLTETLTQTLALLATPVNNNGVIHHKSVFDQAGWFLAESCLSDLEMHIRLGQRYLFVHCDQVTYEFREHANNGAKNHDFAAELKRLYKDIHPITGRPQLELEREATYRTMAARIPGQPAFPPTFTIR